MNVISTIFAVLLLAFLGYVIVKNIIGVVNKVKEVKKKKESAIQSDEVVSDSVDSEKK